MDLATLQSKGGFVPRELVSKELTWTRVDDDGEQQTDTFSVFIAKRVFADVERIHNAPDEQSKSAHLIAALVRLGTDGSERLTYDQAYQLDPSLAACFLNAITEVNTPAPKPKNP